MQHGKCRNALQKRISKLRSRNGVKTIKRLMRYLDMEMCSKSEKYLSHTSINNDRTQITLMEKLILANSSDETYGLLSYRNEEK
jgi:hypothetical protein